MTPARVSVVIPAYGAASFIVRTLDSVAAQTFRDFELVVVDDGSPDDTTAVVDRWLAGAGLTGRCLRQANKKIAGARNAGVREARGELVAFLDHDDLWYPEKLSACVAELDRGPAADLVCHHEDVMEGSRVTRTHRNGPLGEPLFERMLFGGNLLSPSAVVVRRAKLLEAGLFRENPEYNTVEDYDLWLRLAETCRMRIVDRVLGVYVYEDRGASRRISYHHENLERLLLDHFRRRFGDAPTLLQRLRIRRRLAAGYRSALGLLMAYDQDAAAQRGYAMKMLHAWPLDPKNAWRALQWAARAGVGR